ncbi:VOC family protein [Ruania alba]|uniref:VOC family protein n=1 Tax=Ruania alba TaxID=648782 RepID=UPI000B7DEA11|nr:VOC family protein [Ruania alba]
MAPTWLTVFLDFDPARFDVGVQFWQHVTGSDLSPPRGEHDEFATLLPADGDPFLRVQRLQHRPSGVHLDVHLPGREFDVRRSPGGMAYCVVPGPESRRPAASVWPGGHRSIVDQICLDIPARHYDDECAFWSELTGWALHGSTVHTDFRSLVRPQGQPIRVLLQRVLDDRPRVTAHVDLATDDRAAESRRHEALGARVEGVHQWWTVLVDPAGSRYCITDRDTETGMPATSR